MTRSKRTLASVILYRNTQSNIWTHLFFVHRTKVKMQISSLVRIVQMFGLHCSLSLSRKRGDALVHLCSTSANLPTGSWRNRITWMRCITDLCVWNKLCTWELLKIDHGGLQNGFDVRRSAWIIPLPIQWLRFIIFINTLE